MLSGFNQQFIEFPPFSGEKSQPKRKKKQLQKNFQNFFPNYKSPNSETKKTYKQKVISLI